MTTVDRHMYIPHCDQHLQLEMCSSGYHQMSCMCGRETPVCLRT